jgi:hypothetical protein
LEASNSAKLTISADKWDAIWIVYQTFRHAEKQDVPMHVEIKSGSLEVIISVAEKALENAVAAVPQLITYFLRIHGFYAIKEDVRTLKDNVSKAQVTLSSLDERFFQGGFERPLRKLDDAANTVKRTVLEVNHALGFNAGRRHEVLPEVPTAKEEETIQVPASA